MVQFLAHLGRKSANCAIVQAVRQGQCLIAAKRGHKPVLEYLLTEHTEELTVLHRTNHDLTPLSVVQDEASRKLIEEFMAAEPAQQIEWPVETTGEIWVGSLESMTQRWLTLNRMDAVVAILDSKTHKRMAMTEASDPLHWLVAAAGSTCSRSSQRRSQCKPTSSMYFMREMRSTCWASTIILWMPELSDVVSTSPKPSSPHDFWVQTSVPDRLNARMNAVGLTAELCT